MQIQIAGLFPALQYWLALRVTYILPPLPEDTAHLTDRPGKKSENGKSKDSMVVRYGKVWILPYLVISGGVSPLTGHSVRVDTCRKRCNVWLRVDRQVIDQIW